MQYQQKTESKWNNLIHAHVIAYSIIWVILNTLILVDIFLQDVFIGRFGWILIICAFILFLCVEISVVVMANASSESVSTKVLWIHMNYVFWLYFLFLPVLFGAALSENTVSDSRFKEYLTIIFVSSLPSLSILLYYIIERDKNKR